MKVTFLNPPFKSEFGRFSRAQRSPAITKGGTFYYPVWLCYAAGVLENDGFEVQLIDAPAGQMGIEEVESKIKKFSPSLLIIDTSTPSIKNDIEIADRLKQSVQSYTVLVGTHPSALPEKTLADSKHIDAVTIREYEYTLRDLAGELRDHGVHISESRLSAITGLCFRYDNRITRNAEREPIGNLDDLPFVSRIYKKHLNVKDYFYTIAQYPQVAIFSARGCPNRCVYCVYPQVMHGTAYRRRSVQNVIEEFKFIENEMPMVREVFIEDDSFTLSKRRVAEFAEIYKREGLKISWIANSRADIDYETLRLLKSCNCRLLCVGYESGDQKILDQMRKNLRVEKAKQFVKDARRAGILIHGCFIVGNPGETPESLALTLQYAKDLTPDTAQFFPIMVYPGTEAYRWAQENGYLLTEDYSKWNTSDGLHNCLVSRPGLSNKDLVNFCDKARKEFYLRPRYFFYRLARLVRHPVEDGPRMLKSMKQFSKFLIRGTYDRSN